LQPKQCISPPPQQQLLWLVPFYEVLVNKSFQCLEIFLRLTKAFASQLFFGERISLNLISLFSLKFLGGVGEMGEGNLTRAKSSISCLKNRSPT
jgi:hypothetical protein